MPLPKLRSIAVATVVGACLAIGAKPAQAQSQCDLVAGNMVLNCGFETGDFTNWVFLDAGNDLVSSNAFYVHSGNFGRQAGAVGTDGVISQDITTVAGQAYTLSFWYHPEGETPNDINVGFGGSTVFSETDTPAGDWEQITETVFGGPGTTSTLSFGERNDPSFDGLDDIVLTPTTATPEPGSLALMGTGLAGMIGVGIRRRNKK